SLALYGLHRCFGAAGVVVGKWAVIAGTVFLMAGALRSIATNDVVGVIVLFLATHFMGTGFELPRAQLATLFFIAFLVFAFVSDSRLALWLSVPGMVIWVHFHGVSV